MLKKIIPSILVIFIFTGCALKMPSFFPSFLQFEDDDLISLNEANLCQEIENIDSKLFCYKKLLDKNNSYAQLRMGTYHADKKEYPEAVKFLRKSQENKNLYSNLALAFLYYKGDGVKKDVNKSFELLKILSVLLYLFVAGNVNWVVDTIFLIMLFCIANFPIKAKS